MSVGGFDGFYAMHECALGTPPVACLSGVKRQAGGLLLFLVDSSVYFASFRQLVGKHSTLTAPWRVTQHPCMPYYACRIMHVQTPDGALR